MSSGFTTAVQEVNERAALEEVQEEYPKHFEAVQKHPRLLIGQQVPSTTGEGMETLRTSEDAADWQEAMKSLLVDEIRGRAGRISDENTELIRTVHSSIELFQNNSDLVPGTKQFDRQLADQFAQMAKPYEMRVEGALHGYTIPVQPLINQIRDRLKDERSRAAAAAAAPPPVPEKRSPGRPRKDGTSAQPRQQAAPAEPPPAPQAGIPSKAGESSEAETFDDLFGTIGLRGLRF